jgi:hypothetical protein
MKTIDEAKIKMNNTPPGEGFCCPVCDRTVMTYKRKLYATMVRDLIKLYRLGDGYHHINKINKSRGDFAKLTFWGFIESLSNTDESKRTSGMWKITGLGKSFVENRLLVPEAVYLRDNKLKGYAGKDINVTVALGKKFHYQELMEEAI